jgi:hypothetical protein
LHTEACAADAFDGDGDFVRVDAGPGGDGEGLAAGFAGAGGLAAERDGSGAGAAGGAERDLDKFGIGAGAEGIDQCGGGGAALLVGFDGEGFERVGDGDEGLCGDGAGGGKRGRVGDGGEELGGFEAARLYRQDGGGRSERCDPAGADGLAQCLGGFGFTAEDLQGRKVGVDQPGRRRIAIGMGKQAGACFQRLGQVAAGRPGSGFGHWGLRLGVAVVQPCGSRRGFEHESVT